MFVKTGDPMPIDTIYVASSEEMDKEVEAKLAEVKAEIKQEEKGDVVGEPSQDAK